MGNCSSKTDTDITRDKTKPRDGHGNRRDDVKLEDSEGGAREDGSGAKDSSQDKVIGQKEERYTLHSISFYNWSTSRESLILLKANNKSVYQPRHLRSLISAFILRNLERIIDKLSLCKCSILLLVSVAQQARLSFTRQIRGLGPELQCLMIFQHAILNAK